MRQRHFLTCFVGIVRRSHQLVARQFITAFAMSLLLPLGIDGEAKADDPHLGIIEYEISCMPCHGVKGRGDGPRAKTLKTAPADLTQIAKRNKGKFPREEVANIIDGRAAVSAHGQREMPVWGDRYRTSAQTNEPAAWIDQRVREQIAAPAKCPRTQRNITCG